MAIPLMVGPRLIGALDVQSTDAAAFTEEDIEVMHTLADQVAIAIENTRLFDETRRALDESQGVYNRFVQQEWEKITLEQQTHGYISTAAGVQELSKSLDYPEVHQALQSGNPAVEAGEKSGLAIPLKIRGETIGVLNIRTPETDRTWNQDEIGAIQRVADRAALALESVRLLAESERRAQREQVISKVGNRMRQTLDLDTVLRTAADELRQALGLQSAEIRLGLSSAEEMPRKKTRRE
jgi:GAF domain-containing protein